MHREPRGHIARAPLILDDEEVRLRGDFGGQEIACVEWHERAGAGVDMSTTSG